MSKDEENDGRPTGRENFLRWVHAQVDNLILDERVYGAFPNVAIALRIYLVLMVPGFSSERSFSTLKHIKNTFHTSMKQERR